MPNGFRDGRETPRRCPCFGSRVDHGRDAPRESTIVTPPTSASALIATPEARIQPSGDMKHESVCPERYSASLGATAVVRTLPCCRLGRPRMAASPQ